MASFSELMMKVVDGQQLSPIEREQMRQYTNEMDANNQLVSSWQQINKKIDSLFVDLPIGTILSKTLPSDSASVSTQIPQDYNHLFIFTSAKTDYASFVDTINMRFNSDTGTNYNRTSHWVDTNVGGTTSSNVGQWLAITAASLGYTSAATTYDSNAVGTAVSFIPHYRSSLYKNIITITGMKYSSNQMYLEMLITEWKNTSPIRSIDFIPSSGTNMVTGSIFTVLGVK